MVCHASIRNLVGVVKDCDKVSLFSRLSRYQEPRKIQRSLYGTLYSDCTLPSPIIKSIDSYLLDFTEM